MAPGLLAELPGVAGRRTGRKRLVPTECGGRAEDVTLVTRKPPFSPFLRSWTKTSA